MESSSVPWPGAGTFPSHWIDGTNPDEPPLQVHRYAEHTWILRQSVLTDFEGPFLYLFVGQERGLLLVFDVANADVVYADKTLDLSQAVLDKLNQQQ